MSLRDQNTYDRHVQECWLASHPCAKSQDYADTAKPWLEKRKQIKTKQADYTIPLNQLYNLFMYHQNYYIFSLISHA